VQLPQEMESVSNVVSDGPVRRGDTVNDPGNSCPSTRGTGVGYPPDRAKEGRCDIPDGDDADQDLTFARSAISMFPRTKGGVGVLDGRPRC